MTPVVPSPAAAPAVPSPGGVAPPPSGVGVPAGRVVRGRMSVLPVSAAGADVDLEVAAHVGEEREDAVLEGVLHAAGVLPQAVDLWRRVEKVDEGFAVVQLWFVAKSVSVRETMPVPSSEDVTTAEKENIFINYELLYLTNINANKGKFGRAVTNLVQSTQ